MTGKPVAVTGKRKSFRLFPVLCALFVIAWGLLTVLIVLQDRMIDAQRDLIHTISKERAEQATLKSVALRNEQLPAQKRSAKRSNTKTADADDAQAKSSQALPGKSAQAPLSQVPLSENASSQAPSTQVKPKSGDKSGRSSRKLRSPFSRPPAEITDPSDRRRVAISI